MAINSRQKGKRGELDAAKYLKTLGFTARRTQQYSGEGASDIEVDELPNVHIEVKRDKAVAFGTETLRQVYYRAYKERGVRQACVLWRQDRKPWALTFYARNPYMMVTVCGDNEIRVALRWLNLTVVDNAPSGAGDGPGLVGLRAKRRVRGDGSGSDRDATEVGAAEEDGEAPARVRPADGTVLTGE